ncbi:hypothetical protein [Terrabacter sp. MAHUQ-38]|uniref:hypothetical protein n=1 Tax=unclassified Terrabacter TaxID=2630222 RepID=UPI00165E46F2|nr:hypothetical protein [Terrabacter sp. MAHUQ-38]MBC9822922.1 hypothetical protein [Terrabacter sp. MAHUQ-38]
MTPDEVLVPGALAILFVVAWFVVGVIDATRDDRPVQHTDTTDRTPAKANPASHR